MDIQNEFHPNYKFAKHKNKKINKFAPYPDFFFINIESFVY